MWMPWVGSTRGHDGRTDGRTAGQGESLTAEGMLAHGGVEQMDRELKPVPLWRRWKLEQALTAKVGQARMAERRQAHRLWLGRRHSRLGHGSGPTLALP